MIDREVMSQNTDTKVVEGFAGKRTRFDQSNKKIKKEW